jgi:hypothetical protein
MAQAITLLWLAGQPEALPVLRALCWVAGFVFLTLATEADNRRSALALLFVGLGVSGLALLSIHGPQALLVLAFLPLMACSGRWLLKTAERTRPGPTNSFANPAIRGVSVQRRFSAASAHCAMYH